MLKNKKIKIKKILTNIFLLVFCFTIACSLAIAEESSDDMKNIEQKTMDLLTNIDAFNTTDEKLKMDSAKAHYNMGNIYFHKGEFEIAAREYFQAVTLAPNDADSHFNLAFVSGEYLHDFKTAVKHYRLYLYYNPNASDKNFANRKIMEAETELTNVTESYLENEARK